MRTFISIVIVLLFGLFSGSLFAGNVEACEKIKHVPAYKGLYGLCNAYWNADEEDRPDILRNFEKRAPAGVTMPGLGEETGPVGETVPIVCPCWDYDVLEQELACNAYEAAYFGYDNTGDNSGEDWAVFNGPNTIQVFAGNTFFDQVAGNECDIVAPAAFITESFHAVTGEVEDQCRLDVLDLIDAAGNLALCDQ